MVSTRTNNNSKPKKKEVVKNPNQSVTKTPKTPSMSEKSIRAGFETPGTSFSPNQVSKPYVCSDCKNSESIRNASLEANTESLLNKLNTANETFGDSMSKVESISLSLRHFLISTSEEAESSENVLQNLQKDISDLTDRSKTLHDQILRNENILETLAKSVKDFKSTSYA